MKIVASIGAVVLVIIGVGYLATSSSQPASVSNETESAATTNDRLAAVDTSATGAAEPDTAMEEEMMDDAMGAEDTDMMDTDEAPSEQVVTTPVAPTVAGSYQDYSAAALAASTAETKVVFFHASWCPSCRALDNDITANQANIPDGVAIFKADFDAETALKQDFGIVRQHSVVQLDANGSLASSVSHPATLAQLVSSL